jgi:PAS domain S-box-containing protein
MRGAGPLNPLPRFKEIGSQNRDNASLIIRRSFQGNPQIVAEGFNPPTSDVGGKRDIIAIQDKPSADYQLLAEQVSDMIVRADPAGRITYVSPACQNFGYAPSELVGRFSADLVHPEDQTRFEAHVEGLIAGAASDVGVNEQIRYRRKNGDWVWLEGHLRVLRDAAGRPIELLNVLRDVTERRRLSEVAAEQARFEALAKTVAGVGYWRLDAKTRAVSWSDQMFAIYGLVPGEEPPLDLVMAVTHPDDQRDADERLRLALSLGHNWNDAVTRILRPDGEIRYLEGRGVCERDAEGAVRWVFGTAVDITERKRAEIAALEADAERRAKIELFENAFNYASIGKALVDLGGRFLKVNPAFCNLTGYSEARMLELDFQTITHPDDLEADVDNLQRLLAGEISTYQMDKRYLRADGSVVWAHLSVSMVLGPDRRPRQIIAQVQDLTARREAELALAQSEQRFRRLADNAPDIIAESQLDGKLTYISPACLSITGYAQDELLGKTSLSFMHPDDSAAVSAMCNAVLDSGGALAAWPIEFRTFHKDGRPLWLESKPTLARDPLTGAFTGFNDVIRDITRRKALEAELRRAQAQAEAAAAVKGEFLANMSHEIRTPLTAILGFSNLLAERDGMDEIGRGHLQRVLTAGRSLLSIVNDVLDFSKLEAGRFEFKPSPVSPIEFTHETLLMFAPEAEAKGLSLDFRAEGDIPAHVALDPDRVRQILFNLIGNAIKFTASGHVRLRLGYEAEGDRLRLSVEDTGQGIDEADQSKLFQRFAQVDGSTTRQHGGTGLGLAICKGLIEAMGGAIAVRSTPGQGSVFTFHIVTPPASAPLCLEDVEARPVSLDGVRVLVVDDNRINRELARVVLEAAGAEVSEAIGGAEAVLLAREAPYDLILLDYRMPGMDGPETLERIRAEPGPNDCIPILVFSADADLSQMVGPGRFDDVVGKPVNPATLIETVSNWTRWDEPARHLPSPPETRDAIGA